MSATLTTPQAELPPLPPEMQIGSEAKWEAALQEALAAEGDPGETPPPEVPSEVAKEAEPTKEAAPAKVEVASPPQEASPATPPEVATAAAKEEAAPTIDPAVEAARAIITRLGGDPEKPETWNDTLASVATPPTIDDVKVTEEEVAPLLQQKLLGDPQIVRVDAEHRTVLSEITRLNQELDALRSERYEAEAALRIPEVKDNPIRVDEYKQRLRDIRDSRAEFDRDLTKMETLRDRQLSWFAQEKQRYLGQVVQTLKSQKFEAVEGERRAKAVQTHLDAFQVKWPLAFQELQKEYAPPAHKIAKLHKDLKAYAIAHPTSISPSDLKEFMRPHFKEIADDVGKSHVAQSQDYGKRAAARTQAATASPAANVTEAPAKGATPPSRVVKDTITEIEDGALGRLRAEFGLS